MLCCYVMLCYVMFCYVTLRYGTVRYGMVWYGMVWYGMFVLCCAVLCYARLDVSIMYQGQPDKQYDWGPCECHFKIRHYYLMVLIGNSNRAFILLRYIITIKNMCHTLLNKSNWLML